MAELMSERLREQLAHRLGVAHLVQGDYWGHVPARDCGRLVREAIRLAEQALAGQAPAAAWTPGPAPAPWATAPGAPPRHGPGVAALAAHQAPVAGPAWTAPGASTAWTPGWH